jgi:hypothetical protein
VAGLVAFLFAGFDPDGFAVGGLHRAWQPSWQQARHQIQCL